MSDFKWPSILMAESATGCPSKLNFTAVMVSYFY